MRKVKLKFMHLMVACHIIGSLVERLDCHGHKVAIMRFTRIVNLIHQSLTRVVGLNIF